MPHSQPSCHRVILLSSHLVILSICKIFNLSSCHLFSLSALQLVRLSICQPVGLSACKLVSLSACKLASFKLAHLGACELVYYWNAHYTKNAWTNLVCCKPDWVTPYKSSFSSSFFSSNKKWQKKIVSALTFVVSDWVTACNWVLPEFLATSLALMLILLLGTIFFFVLWNTKDICFKKLNSISQDLVVVGL